MQKTLLLKIRRFYSAKLNINGYAKDSKLFFFKTEDKKNSLKTDEKK